MRKPFQRLVVVNRGFSSLLFSCASIVLVFTSSSLAYRGTNAPYLAQLIGPGERREAEQRLSDLGYWTGPVDGVLDPLFRHALIAFQKVAGRKRTGKLTSEELEALRIAVRPIPRHTGYAHVEIDLQR